MISTIGNCLSVLMFASTQTFFPSLHYVDWSALSNISFSSIKTLSFYNCNLHLFLLFISCRQFHLYSSLPSGLIRYLSFPDKFSCFFIICVCVFFFLSFHCLLRVRLHIFPFFCKLSFNNSRPLVQLAALYKKKKTYDY